MRKALLFVLLIPVIEILVLIEVGGQIGGLASILLIFSTAIFGLLIIKKQGGKTLLKAQEKLRANILPAQEMVDGLLLAIAGVFLLIPGFVTDAIGILLLIPPIRKGLFFGVFMKLIVSKMKKTPHGASRFYENTGEIIEGEYIKENKDQIDKN
ncbi:FxsA family protein [Marinomonas sp. 15G1-11]|uniref:FxsA family protein n=1 Tax=Marinomonas phaeophyticola TaxID=3004091 RepID=A0ABT4JPP4_9GAMM|nr:FxsA family protein [Marinomonas sp. 15G1-11]MCZ2720353.1 FxsA family protein [Marinomonas sp. 15G1-11]